MRNAAIGTLALLFASQAWAMPTTTLDFEDTVGNFGGLEDTADITWGSNWVYWLAPSWYETASGEKIAYWNQGGEAWVYFNQPVTFLGSWFDHDPFNVGKNVSWWEGYRNGVKMFESEHYAEEPGRFISVHWKNIDAVRLHYTDDNLLIIDDFSYVVPEPGTAALLALGGLGLIALRRRR